MAVAQVPANIAAALRYGPSTQSALRKSQYLNQALQQLQETGGQNIQSPLELGSKLLATAILSRRANKADQAAVGALKSDQNSETAALISALRPQQAPQAPQPQTQPAPVPAPQQPVSLPSAAPAPPPVSQLALNPDVDKLVRTVWGEARGEDPLGQLGVANVVINRAKKGGRSIGDVVSEPNQFEPWSNPKTRAQLDALTPDSPDYQRILANITPALQGQDVTGGADHFYSPTAQAAAGRSPPRWDDGSGVDHGRHRFFNLGYGGQGAHQRTSPSEMFQTVQPQQPPVNVATNGQVDPSMLQASAPVGPSGGGAAPAAPNAPQAAAAGANPWPNYQPSDAEIGYVQSLLQDPRTHDQGVAEAMKLRQKMTQPQDAQIVQMNGVSYYVPKDPTAGAAPVMIPVPQGAKTQTVSAQQAGLPTAPQGAYVQQDPFGNLKEAPFAPPQGYNAGPNGYSPIAGGPADPHRVQAPPSGYQLQGQQYVAIPGGPADPTSAANTVQNEGQLRKEYEGQGLLPYIAARNGYEKVLRAAGDNSGASDIALIFGFMKTLDPTSTVREGEFATAQNSGSVDQSLMNLYNRALKGERLQPVQRAEFAKTAQGQFAVAQDRFDQLNQRYQGISQAYGYDPKRIVQTFPAIGTGTQSQRGAPAPNPAIVATPGTRDAAIAEARRRGLIK